MLSFQENAMEWFTGYKTVSCSFTQERFIRKFQEYSKSHPKEVKITEVFKDGSICVKFPLSWLKISPPKKKKEDN